MKCSICEFEIKNKEAVCPVCNTVIEANIDNRLSQEKKEVFISYNIYKNSRVQKYFEVIICVLLVLILFLFFNYALASPILELGTTKIFKSHPYFLFYNLTVSYIISILLMNFALYTFDNKKINHKKYIEFKKIHIMVYLCYLIYYISKYFVFINPVIIEIYSKYPVKNVLTASLRIIKVYKFTYVFQTILHLGLFISIKNINIDLSKQFGILIQKYKYKNSLVPSAKINIATSKEFINKPKIFLNREQKKQKRI